MLNFYTFVTDILIRDTNTVVGIEIEKTIVRTVISIATYYKFFSVIAYILFLKSNFYNLVNVLKPTA